MRDDAWSSGLLRGSRNPLRLGAMAVHDLGSHRRYHARDRLDIAMAILDRRFSQQLYADAEGFDHLPPWGGRTFR
jgi:hypothetical protein